MTKARAYGRRVGIFLLIVAPLGLAGCTPWNPGFYPFSMGIFTPIPVPPWVTERMEEKYNHENDFRTAILPPVIPGTEPPQCEDPPDDAMVLRAWQKVARGVPYFYEEFRDGVSIVKTLMVDKIDPPRFFPLIGMAQVHHCHWKCTIYYTQTIQSSYPFPFKWVRPRVKVLYVDKDHLHLAPGGTPEVQRQISRDLIGQ